MHRHTVFLVIVLLAAGAGCRKEPPILSQLTNGGFELPLDSGWVQTVANEFGTRGYIERSDTLGQPGGGFAVRLYKFQRERVALSQTFELETPAQVVRFDARFRLGADVPCTPVATVAFNYLDSTGVRLGRTLFYLPSSYCTWTDSDSLHLIRVTDTTGAWHEYRLNLEDELSQSLPLVDRSRVCHLGIELVASVEASG